MRNFCTFVHDKSSCYPLVRPSFFSLISIHMHTYITFICSYAAFSHMLNVHSTIATVTFTTVPRLVLPSICASHSIAMMSFLNLFHFVYAAPPCSRADVGRIPQHASNCDACPPPLRHALSHPCSPAVPISTARLTCVPAPRSYTFPIFIWRSKCTKKSRRAQL